MKKKEYDPTPDEFGVTEYMRLLRERYVRHVRDAADATRPIETRAAEGALAREVLDGLQGLCTHPFILMDPLGQDGHRCVCALCETWANDPPVSGRSAWKIRSIADERRRVPSLVSDDMEPMVARYRACADYETLKSRFLYDQPTQGRA